MAPHVLRTLARRIRMIAARGVVNLVNDGLKVQGVQMTLLADETMQGQRFQEYGFTSVPKAGAEAIMLSIAGVRSHGVVIATDDGRYRVKNLKAGEVALYTDEGDTIIFKRGGKIAITSGGEVDVTAPTVNLTATAAVSIVAPIVSINGSA